MTGEAEATGSETTKVDTRTMVDAAMKPPSDTPAPETDKAAPKPEPETKVEDEAEAKTDEADKEKPQEPSKDDQRRERSRARVQAIISENKTLKQQINELQGRLAGIEGDRASGKITDKEAATMKRDLKEVLDEVEAPDELKQALIDMEKRNAELSSHLEKINADIESRKQSELEEAMKEAGEEADATWSEVQKEFTYLFDKTVDEGTKEEKLALKPEMEKAFNAYIGKFSDEAKNELLSTKEGLQSIFMVIGKPIREAIEAKREADRVRYNVNKVKAGRVEHPESTGTATPSRPPSTGDLVKEAMQKLKPGG